MAPPSGEAFGAYRFGLAFGATGSRGHGINFTTGMGRHRAIRNMPENVDLDTFFFPSMYKYSCIYDIIFYNWLVVWNMNIYDYPFSWECHNPI